MEFIFTVFNILSSFLTDFLYKISLVNHLFIFDINKKNIYIKNNKLNNTIIDITSDQKINNISKAENNNKKNIINQNIKRNNIKNNTDKNETLLIGREIKFLNRKNKKAKTINSYFSSSSKFRSNK